MPTVPGPSRSAFGGGAAQAQFGLAQAQLNLASSLSGAAQTIFQTQNKEKFRDDAVMRASDRREFRMRVRQDAYRRFYENNPTSSADVEALKEEISQLAGEYADNRKYNFPESKAQLMGEIDEIAGQFILEADAVARKGGQREVMGELDDLATRLTDQIAENPSSLPDAIVTVDRAFAEEGIAALGVGKADEARNMVVSALAKRGVESALLKRNFVGVEQIMGNDDVRRAMTQQERSKVISAVDSAKILAKQEDRQYDLNQATLLLREAQALSHRAEARLTNAEAHEKELENALTTGGREPSPEEAETLRQARLKTAQALRDYEESGLDIDAKKIANARAQAEWDYDQKNGLARSRKLEDKSQQYLAENEQYFAEGSTPPARVVANMLAIATGYMESRSVADGQTGGPPPRYSAILGAPNIGVDVGRYYHDRRYQREVDASLHSRSQAENAQGDAIGQAITRSEVIPDAVVPESDTGLASASEAPIALGAAPEAESATGPAPAAAPEAESATGPAPAAVAGAGADAQERAAAPTVEALNPANKPLIDEMQEEATPEKADKNIRSLVDKSMQVYNNVDLAYGLKAGFLATMYKFGPTSVLVPEQAARAQARTFLKGALRQLIASTDHPGRFTDAYREYLTREFETLQASFLDNPENIRSTLEATTLVLGRQYEEHWKEQQLALAGDSTVAPGTAASAGDKMRAIKSMLKVVGAPVLIGRDPVTGGSDVSSMEEFEARVAYMVDIDFLEPGDHVKFGGQVYAVGNEPDEENQ